MKHLTDTTLLFVEDDANVRDLMMDFLARKVKKLYIANNGLEGLELYKKYNPNVVITDMIMPVMDGIEMITEIKKINKNQPAAIISAFDEKDHSEEILKLDISQFIKKPINDLSLFLETIEKMANVSDKDINNSID